MPDISKETVKSLATSLDALIQQAALSDNTNLSERARLQFDQLKAALPHDAGGAATSDWATLGDADQKAKLDELTAKINDLTIELSPAGLKGSRMMMSASPAPSSVILGLLLLAMVGIVAVLLFIGQNWEAAIKATNVTAALKSAGTQPAQPKGKTPDAAKSSDATPKGADDNAKKSSDQSADAAKSKDAPPTKDTSPSKDASQTKDAAQGKEGGAKSDDAAKQAEADRAGEKSPTVAEQTTTPKQTDVLLMVILLGTLGGLIHLASSLTIYVGNRDLKRSWIVYYLLAPFQGAALAPLLYLLLKSSVLTPQAANGNVADNLNLTAIYAFAGLTGLFAKQAIEKLADVFATLFSSMSQAKDKTKDGATAKK